MTHRVKLPVQPLLLAGATIIALALGCTNGDAPPLDTAPGPSSAGSSASASGGSSVAGGAGPGAGAGGSGTCQGSVVSDSKRVVRLSFNQISRTIHALLGDTFGAKADADYEIGAESPTPRTFPPLSSPQEGSSITTGIWQKVDLIAVGRRQLRACESQSADGLRGRAERCLRTSLRP